MERSIPELVPEMSPGESVGAEDRACEGMWVDEMGRKRPKLCLCDSLNGKPARFLEKVLSFCSSFQIMCNLHLQPQPLISLWHNHIWQGDLLPLGMRALGPNGAGLCRRPGVLQPSLCLESGV